MFSFAPSCYMLLLALIFCDFGQGIFVFSNSPDPQWAPPSLLLNVYRSYFPGYIGRCVKLIFHLHRAWGLRMTVAIPLLPLYALLPWTGFPMFLFLSFLFLFKSKLCHQHILSWRAEHLSAFHPTIASVKLLFLLK